MNEFYKSTKDVKVSGVLSGLSAYFKIDVSLLRVLFVLGTLFLFGLPGIITYIVLAIYLPTDVELANKNSEVEVKVEETIEDSSVLDLGKE